MLSISEQTVMQDIERRLIEMRAHLLGKMPSLDDTGAWYTYLAKLKAIQGNSSNAVSFVATLLVKQYLEKRYGINDFDAAAKSQNAPGIDIDVLLPDGQRLVAELKTTNPYKPNDFGAQQRKSIKKDFLKLANANADVKLFLVTDPITFGFMKKSKYQSILQGITVVLLTTGEEFTA
jgi:hypothetical protein